LQGGENMKEAKFQTKLLDSVYGVAIGDALGVPAEFKTRETLAQNPVTDMLDSFMPKGTYSDDTAMTLCNLASFVEHNWELYPYDIMERFLKWADKGYMAVDGDVFDIGVTTRKAITNFYNKVPLEECGGKSFYECGNGSLMRIIPLVFYLQKHPEADKYSVIKQISALTHTHDVCTIGCYIYVLLCLSLLNNENVNKHALFKDELPKIFNSINNKVDKEWLDLYARIFDFDSFINLQVNDIKSDGYVVNTLEAALWCFLTTEDYCSCVLKAVNLGSDTDTTAAVAGGMAGLYYGKRSIPTEWIEALRNKDVIDELCEE